METNPATEVSEASVEDRLAAAFEKAGMKDTPEPEPVEEPAEPEAETDDSEDDSEAEATTEETTADSEEVEFEGEVYALPKKLKDALLRQQDYTKKTQAVAERNKAIDLRAEAVETRAKFIDAHSDKIAEARSLGLQLQQFAQVNWAELAEANPAQYMQLDRQQRMLSEASNRVNAEIQHLGNEFQGQVLQNKQRAQARCIEELKKDYKDFGPKFLENLDETGRSFGFSGEELASIVDPRMIRVLHAAMQHKKLQGSKALVEKKVQDAKPVQVKAARSAQTSQANATLTNARTQMKKTGKAQDAEAFLAARFAKSMR